MALSPHRPIATLNEGPLHAALKTWYAEPGDVFEVPLAGRQIDLVRGDLLVEIQTGSLGALKLKLRQLLKHHPVRVVYPVTAAKWIVREDDDGAVLSRRKSPKRGGLVDAFWELVSLPRLFRHERFTCELVLVKEEEVRRHRPRRKRRRKGWVTTERRLLEVVDSRLLCDDDDLRNLLPPGLPAPFTTADLAAGLGCPRNLAQKMAYVLREAQAIRVDGKRGNALLYLAEAA